MHKKRALIGLAGGAYSDPPDPLGGFKGAALLQEREVREGTRFGGVKPGSVDDPVSAIRGSAAERTN